MSDPANFQASKRRADGERLRVIAGRPRNPATLSDRPRPESRDRQIKYSKSDTYTDSTTPKTGFHWPKLALSGKNWRKLASDWLKLAKTGSNWLKLAKTGENWPGHG